MIASIMSAMAKHLQTRKAIRNLVGPNSIFRGRIPSTFRESLCIVLTRTGENPYYNLDGEDGLTESFVDVNCVATHETAGVRCEQLASEVRSALSGFRGWWDKVYVSDCTIENFIDLIPPPQDGSSEWPVQYVLDFRINWRQSNTPLLL